MSADAFEGSAAPPPRVADLSRLLRDVFWRVDPVGVSDDAEFTWSEYHDIADRTAARGAASDDIDAIEMQVAEELRRDWGVSSWRETAAEVATAIRSYRDARPAVVAARERGLDDPLSRQVLDWIGQWIAEVRPDRVQRFETRERVPVDPRGSVTQLEVWPRDARHVPVEVTVVNGGIVTVSMTGRGYREIDLDGDLPDVIDDITSELLTAFPLIIEPRADLDRLGERIRAEIRSLGLTRLDVPEALVPGLTMDVMAYGRRLGLLTAGAAVAGSLRRLESGVALTDDEEWIALTLADDLRSVEDTLDDWPIAPGAIEHCERFWIAVTFHLVLETWDSDSPLRAEFPAAEMDAAWGSTTAFTRTVRSRRLFRGRRGLRKDLEVDLRFEMVTLAAAYSATADMDGEIDDGLVARKRRRGGRRRE